VLEETARHLSGYRWEEEEEVTWKERAVASTRPQLSDSRKRQTPRPPLAADAAGAGDGPRVRRARPHRPLRTGNAFSDPIFLYSDSAASSLVCR
jgi:hypothetical protein